MRMRIAFEKGSLPSLPRDPRLLDVWKQFHDTWGIVLAWEKEYFWFSGDGFPVIEAGLCAQDATPEIERGWAAFNGRKGLNRLSSTAELKMDDSMNTCVTVPPCLSRTCSRGYWGYWGSKPHYTQQTQVCPDIGPKPPYQGGGGEGGAFLVL